ASHFTCTFSLRLSHVLTSSPSHFQVGDPVVIDSHCHLADEVFAGDLEAVVGRAREGGVERVLVILAAGDTKEAAQALTLVTIWPEARVSIGVHPHQAHQFAGDPARVSAIVRA